MIYTQIVYHISYLISITIRTHLVKYIANTNNMNSFLSEIFASPRDREDFIIALVVLGLFGGFILNYALVDTPEEVPATAFVTSDELDTHLLKLEEEEVERPTPRRVIVDDDIEEVRKPNTFVRKEHAITPAVIEVVDDIEDIDLDIASTNIETDIFDDAVAQTEEATYIEEESPVEEEPEVVISEEVEEEASTSYQEEVIEEEPVAVVEQEEAPAPAEVIEEEQVPTVPLPAEFNAKGENDYDCLIIVGAFKVAENANVIIAQLEKGGFEYKKIMNRGFTCVGIPMACSNSAGIVATKAKMKAQLKVDPWVLRK